MNERRRPSRRGRRPYRRDKQADATGEPNPYRDTAPEDGGGADTGADAGAPPENPSPRPAVSEMAGDEASDGEDRGSNDGAGRDDERSPTGESGTAALPPSEAPQRNRFEGGHQQ